MKDEASCIRVAYSCLARSILAFTQKWGRANEWGIKNLRNG